MISAILDEKLQKITNMQHPKLQHGLLVNFNG